MDTKGRTKVLPFFMSEIEKSVLTIKPLGIILNAHLKDGRLAQLGERHPYKVDVGGSIPSTPTIFFYP